MRARSLRAVLALALCLGAPSIAANGRFPRSQTLRHPTADTLALTGTFGLLISANRGADFQYVCERELLSAISIGWVDPLLETSSDGTLYTGSTNALRVTRDRGCTFETDWSLPVDPSFVTVPQGQAVTTGSVIDLCRAANSPDILALTTVRGAEGETVAQQLYRAAPGSGFQPFGRPISPDQAPLVLTVDSAPSREQRLYVSANKSGQNLLLVSDDAGQTWTSKPIDVGDTGIADTYIAAVSASDPDRVYVRVRRQIETAEGDISWDDSLLVSSDAGTSFREVLRRKASLMGFALSPDGKTVLAGFGDPVDMPIVTVPADFGIYVASTESLTFVQQVEGIAVSCLSYNTQGLYVCAREDDPLGTEANAALDFQLGVYAGQGLPSHRSDFTPLLKLKDVRGPIPWTDGRQSACVAEWTKGAPENPELAATCRSLSADCTMTTPLSAGAITCSSTPSGGGAGATGGANSLGGVGGTTGGAGRSGGANSRGGAGSTGGAHGAGQAGASAQDPPRDPGGCAYSVQANRRLGAEVFALMAMAWVAVLRTRSLARIDESSLVPRCRKNLRG
jgi:hypothetical protein